MSEKSDAAEEALARVRRTWSPSASETARVRRGIERAIAAGTPAPAIRATSDARAGLSARIALAGALAAATGGVGYWAGHRDGRHGGPALSPARVEQLAQHRIPARRPGGR